MRTGTSRRASTKRLCPKSERGSRGVQNARGCTAVLAAAIQNLAEAGVKRVWIGGSFVSDKDEPNDVDGCWDDLPGPVDVSKLDAVFLETSPPRSSMRRKYGVDFLIARRRLADREAQGGTVLDFFQTDRDGNARGVLLLELGARQ